MSKHDTLFDDQLVLDVDTFDEWDEDALDMSDYDDEPIEVDEATACSLENPESCESCT
jgi:hypothetical protein